MPRSKRTRSSTAMTIQQYRLSMRVQICDPHHRLRKWRILIFVFNVHEKGLNLGSGQPALDWPFCRLCGRLVDRDAIRRWARSHSQPNRKNNWSGKFIFGLQGMMQRNYFTWGSGLWSMVTRWCATMAWQCDDWTDKLPSMVGKLKMHCLRIANGHDLCTCVRLRQGLTEGSQRKICKWMHNNDQWIL